MINTPQQTRMPCGETETKKREEIARDNPTLEILECLNYGLVSIFA
jgi:hypothetical protein